MICTLTINPAMDRIIYLQELTKGNTNRIQGQKDVLGGKGTHVSVNLGILGCENKAFGIDFGETGDRIEALLKNEKVDLEFLHYTYGESRTNYAVVESDGCCTLFSEKGRRITLNEGEALLRKIEETIQEGDILVLSGDASNTEAPLYYIEVMDRLKDKKVRFFLDSSSDNLIEGIRRKPFLIKPNEDELGQILGRKVVTEEEIVQGIVDLAKLDIPCIAVTCGGNGSFVWYASHLYRIHPLKVNVVNTIGCGDAFLSGMAYGFEKGYAFEESLRCAAAISSATAEEGSTVGFKLDRAMELKNLVQIEEIPY